MKIDDMSLSDLKKVLNCLVNNEDNKYTLDKSNIYEKDNFIEKGTYVIVRAKDAGVLCGFFESCNNDGSKVYLTLSRQMWSWEAMEGGTLIDCAKHGVKTGKFSDVSDRAIIINACAIIECSAKASESLRKIKSSWK